MSHRPGRQKSGNVVLLAGYPTAPLVTIVAERNERSVVKVRDLWTLRRRPPVLACPFRTSSEKRWRQISDRPVSGCTTVPACRKHWVVSGKYLLYRRSP